MPRISPINITKIVSSSADAILVDGVKPLVFEAMKEIGISISTDKTKMLALGVIL